MNEVQVVCMVLCFVCLGIATTFAFLANWFWIPFMGATFVAFIGMIYCGR